jgi:hypothetical protein
MESDEKNGAPATTQRPLIEEIRKGVLSNLTPKPAMPSSVTSSTGQSVTTQTGDGSGEASKS